MPRPVNFWRAVIDGTLPYDWNAETQRLVWIVSVATHHPPGVNVQSGARCAGASVTDGCDGRLLLRWDDACPPIIRWACAKCGEESSVWGWDEMEYDARKQIPIGVPRAGELLVSLTIAEYDTFVAYLYDEPVAPSQRVRCSGVLDPSDSTRVIVRGTRDEIDHVMDFLIGEALAEYPEITALPELWHRLDEALALSGDAERHDRRDARLRLSMREWFDGSGTPEPKTLRWRFPAVLDGFALVQPQRATVLRAEWDALRDADGR